MNKSSMYIGVVVTSEDDDGHETARYHAHGPDYHELDYEDVVSMEAALAPLAEEYDALARKVEAILLAAGFEKAGLSTPGNKPAR